MIMINLLSLWGVQGEGCAPEILTPAVYGYMQHDWIIYH